MRRLAMQAVVLVTALFSVTALAESIYRYRDTKTKRDVFVSHRDQIPAAYREQAQPVVADGVLVDSVHQANENNPAGTVIYGDRQPAGWWEAIGQMAEQAMHSPSRIDWRRGLSTAVDTDLVRRGVRPLSADETQRGLHRAASIGWTLLAAGSLALVSWVVVMIQAWMAEQRTWALGMFLCQPLALLYALRSAKSKSRWWRAIMALVQVLPHAVLVTGAVWLHAWFSAVLRSRGL